MMYYRQYENLRYLTKILSRFDRKIFPLAAAGIVTGSLIPYLSILIPKYAIAGLIGHEDLTYWVLFFLFLGVGGVCLYALNAFFSSQFKAHINSARNGCFGQMLTDKMLHMKYALLEQPNIQELCFRANFLFWSDNNGMAGVFDGIRIMLTGLLTLAGLVVLLSNFQPLLFILLTVMVFINIALLTRARREEDELRPETIRINREKEYLNQNMRDLTTGKDIRLYGMNGFLSRWFHDVSSRSELASSKTQRGYTRAGLWGAALAFIRDAVVYGSLLYAVFFGQIRADDFILYIGTASTFTETLIAIIDRYLAVRQFLGHTNDFRQAMELEEEPVEESPTIPKAFADISLCKVSFQYPGSTRYVLEDIDLTIRSGEHIAVVGRNGAGKTTLVKLLVGLYAPVGGSIIIHGNDGNPIEAGDRFSLFSVVMQKIYQYPFTLQENITFQEKGKEDAKWFSEAVGMAGLTEDIRDLPYGIDTLLRKDFDMEGVTLSGGQLQKLALARALYKNAPVVILDEPSAALDPLAEQELYERFYRLLNEKTCVFISHRLSSVKFCDRIILLDQGRIAGCGTHERLLSSCPQYAALWEAQSHPYQEEKEET